MFLDASVIVAILAQEADGPEFSARLAKAKTVLTSPIAIFEAVLALGRIGEAPIDTVEKYVLGFLSDIPAEIVTIYAAIGSKAADAFKRYGKGRHPAALNMGDCFAYACARHYHVPAGCCVGRLHPPGDVWVARLRSLLCRRRVLGQPQRTTCGK